MSAEQALQITEPAPDALDTPEIDAGEIPQDLDTRRALAKRLADVICIPASSITPQERHMAGDILVELLRDTDIELRESVARRLVMLNEAPRTILIMLATDDIRVAKHVLEKSKSLTDSDLIRIAKRVSMEHRVVLASRRHVSDAVVDIMVQFLEEPVVLRLLRNKGAHFSETAIQRILTISRSVPSFVEPMVRRDELRPSHGLTMFWWADTPTRRKILHRFAVTRSILQNTCFDLYPRAAKDGWNDAGVRKALQFIERRQRNRAAIERSKFDSLEAAIDSAELAGLTREYIQEISYMAGIKPATGAQIMTDKTGEAMAVLCKAPGLKREYLLKLWRAAKKPEVDANGEDHPQLKAVMRTYDEISTDKAQTVLRYWNWSLTSSLNPEVLEHIKRKVIPREDEHGAAAITAALVFGHNPG